jgi:hypothetical protein
VERFPVFKGILDDPVKDVESVRAGSSGEEAELDAAEESFSQELVHQAAVDDACKELEVDLEQADWPAIVE